VIGKEFYVVGRRDSGITNVRDTIFILHLGNAAKGWQKSPAKLPTAHGGLSSVVIGSKIYTFGG
jgi:N-acetylneuraminic acid mutarotase